MDIIDRVRTALVSSADERTLRVGQTFFKEKVARHGVKVPTVNRIGRELFHAVERRTKSEIFDLCEALWRSGYLEESFIACRWSHKIRNRFEPEDFAIFERWIDRHVTNWASCDTLCNHTVGSLIMMYPSLASRLKAWAGSPNRWMRRAAAVTLIVPARRGLFLDVCLALADILLLDGDDLVQKGYGWMLKAASEAHQPEIFAYVCARKSVMPRTALRYAIEKMPAALKAQAMARG